jgi:hypothetical protein
MFRRNRLDLEKARAQVEQARRAADTAAHVREEVEAADGEIMREAERHKRLLRINNFAAKVHAALGGEGA